MKKTPITRKIASAIFAITFVVELVLFSPILSSYPTTQLSAGHLITIILLSLIPIAAVLVVSDKFTTGKTKYVFTYSMLLYLATNVALYSSTATFYAAGLQAADVNTGYIALGAKVAIVLIAVLLSILEPKEKVIVDEIEEDEEDKEDEEENNFFKDSAKEVKEVKEVKAPIKEDADEAKAKAKAMIEAKAKADYEKAAIATITENEKAKESYKLKSEIEKSKEEAAIKAKAKDDAVKDIVAEIVAEKKSETEKQKMYDLEK